MSRLPCDFTLTAQRSRLDELTRAFRNRPSHVDTQYVLTGLLVLTAIVLGLWLLSQLLARQEGRRPSNSAWMLFLSLSKAHGLSWPERWLLWRVARHHRLRDPARLFLEPERLAEESLSPALRPRQSQVKALRERLFAGLQSTPGEPGGSGTPSDSPPSRAEPPRQPTAADPLSLSFPIADNPALDVPPWVRQTDAGSP